MVDQITNGNRDEKGRFKKIYGTFKCVDCDKIIGRHSIRCHGCNSRFQNTGKKLSKEHKEKIKTSLSLKKEIMRENALNLWKNKEYSEKQHKSHLGNIPWNKGLKTGIVPKTIFKKENIPWNNKLSQSVGKIRKMIYIHGTKKLVSHVIWCSQKGNLSYIPNGFVIHHLDLNPENNSPENLILLPRSFHSKLHAEIYRRLKCQ